MAEGKGGSGGTGGKGLIETHLTSVHVKCLSGSARHVYDFAVVLLSFAAGGEANRHDVTALKG
jgi:hypothetical protein